jgi:hypothetical protein
MLHQMTPKLSQGLERIGLELRSLLIGTTTNVEAALDVLAIAREKIASEHNIPHDSVKLFHSDTIPNRDELVTQAINIVNQANDLETVAQKILCFSMTRTVFAIGHDIDIEDKVYTPSNKRRSN